MSLRFLRIFAGFVFAALLAGPVAAQEIYTVANVHVDATGSSSTEAMNTALAQGRPKAWQTLYRRLTRQADWGRQPMLDSAGLLRLSRGYNIANERRSTTRYVADVTYMFNPAQVMRTLQSSGIAYTQGTPRRILIVPMSPTYSTGPWAQALAAPALRDSVIPFAVASTADAPALGGLSFDNATWGDVSAVASRIQASQAALVQVVYANNKVTVNIRRIGIGETPVKVSVDVPTQQTVVMTYPAAAQAAIRAIEDIWKTRTSVDFSQRGRLTVIARPNTAAQWGAIRTALANVDNVTSVHVNVMDIGYAQMVVGYQGSPEQLREALGQAGLSLANRAGEWSIAQAGGQ